MDGVQSSSSVPRIQVFRPTWEEFKDFNSYILQIEKAGAHKAGLAKIIPPPEWKPRADGYDMNIIGDIDIPAPISQVVQGKQGVYQQFNIQKNSMKVKELKRMAENPRYATPPHFDYEDLDRKYWRNISYFPPIYGADVSGSLTDPDVEEWNINKLGSILDYVNEDYGISIDGVNTAYLYFGMWKSSFAWHTEDMDLYSINYLHFGEPKSWYCVPPDHGARLERLANNFFPSNCKECPAYLRHKMTVISPAVLKNHCIPVNKIVQEAGEFMITFPYGYHAGFNHGFNCAESTNFASPRWVEYGKRATQCSCRPDMVKISMDTFVKRFQPDRYDLWVQGKDIGPHPEVPGRNSAAPHPSREEILCNKNNPDLPESFVEPTKKKAKRHLIHQKLEQPEEQQQEQVAIKEEIISPLECEEPVTEEDSDLVESDEQAFEVMKEIYYKAGEMESDGLDDWDKEKSDESKRKGKKPVKRPKLKSIGSSISGSSSSDSQQLTLKHRRIKPEFVQRNPSLQVGAVESTAPSSTGTPAKLAPVRPVNMFSGFRIPKKAPIPAADIDAWTEAEHNASRALTSLAANVHFTPTIKRELPDQCESKKEFSKTRIQTPSPNSHIKSCPAVAQRCPSPTSPFQHGSTSSSGIVSASHKALEASASSADIQMNKPVFQQPIIHMKNSKSPGSDERRSRKQKCPRSNRSGLDARDLSANLTHLWLKQKDWTLTIEAEFNLLSSRQEPYCSVCSLLRPPAVQRDQQHQPTSSTVLLPEELFGSNRSGSTSILLRCSSCRVCVHAKCYGVSESVSAITWLCRRCERSEDSAKCCLCVQRGGALKSTSDGRWAHILCTLCFPSVFFNQPALREPIVVDQLSRDSVLLSCTFCSDQSDSSKVFYHGICMPCCGSSAGKRCGRAFHPMCGLVNGVRFSLSQEGQISGSCCSPSSRVSVKKKIPHPVPIGQQVYAKHPDGRFCLADVIDNSTTVTFYSVDFSDGSKSQDTFPEDIRNYNCREDGPPPLGAAVDVMWTDGKCYDGYYRGQNHIILYKLRFCDGDDTVVEAERDKFYHPDEDLPKRLRDQLGKQLIVPAHMNRLHHPNFQS